MTRVVVLDYGFGNLRSAERALERAGAEVEVTAEHRAAVEADGLVVPGVGAFAACMAGLQAVGGDKIIDERLSDGRPVLGICVGMQVLFDRGVEHDVSAEGCGRWPGAVERVRAQVLPHMGWNQVEPPDGTTLFAGISAGTHFYFVHSFAVRAWESDSGLPTWCEHGEPFVAAAEDGPLAATQFHPEKSGEPGAALLRNWLHSVASGPVR